MMDCIQPVLTKCDNNDDDLDLEKIKTDLIAEFMQEFESRKSSSPKAKDENIDNPELNSNDLKQFYVDFIGKLEIFDPLDRDFPQKVSKTVKRDDLLTAIGSMKPVPGGGVYSPFSPKQLVKFNEMIKHEFKLCEKKVHQLIQEAEEMGEHYSFDLRYERVFESFERYLRYFAEKQLLIDGERRLHKFYIYLRNSERMIELAQLTSGLNNEAKDILKGM